MTKYIDKAAIVAEIEEIIADETESIKSFEHRKNVSEVQRSNARIGVLMHIRSLLDTLETKEVDLKKDFELTWEDVAWIVNKTILQCKVESILTAEDICKEVLKQFKAQKGE